MDRHAGGTDNGAVLLAVQPERFARVALWPSGSLDRPPASLGRRSIRASPVRHAAAYRVRGGAGPVTGPTGIAPGTDLTLWVVGGSPQDGGQVPVTLGALHRAGCPPRSPGARARVTMISIDRRPSHPA